MPIQAYSKNPVPIITKFHLDESAAIYLTHTIRLLSISLVGIFIPILIFTLPNKVILYSNPTTNGLVWVLIFFLLRSLTVYLMIFAMGEFLLNKLHLKRAILISTILLGIQLFFWPIIEDALASGQSLWSWFIVLQGILSGLMVYSYWVPHHIFFVRKNNETDHNQHYGKITGIRSFLEKLASTFGPIIGGVIIYRFGFDPLFYMSLILLSVAALPVLASVTENQHHQHNPKEIAKRYLFNPAYKKITLALAGRAMDDVIYSIFWPVFLFIVLDSYIKVGTLTTVSLMISLIAVIWAGNQIERNGGQIIHRFGVIINSLLNASRAFFQFPLFVYANDITDRLNSALYALPFAAKNYEMARALGDIDFIIYREMALHLFYVITCGVCILLLPFLPNWQYVFLIAAVGSGLSYFIHSRVSSS